MTAPRRSSLVDSSQKRLLLILVTQTFHVGLSRAMELFLRMSFRLVGRQVGPRRTPFPTDCASTMFDSECLRLTPDSHTSLFRMIKGVSDFEFILGTQKGLGSWCLDV